MEPRSIQVVLAVDDAGVRAQLAGILKQAGYAPQIIGSAAELRHLTPQPGMFVILETGDDAAALTQRVYELHVAFKQAGCSRPAIIGMVSPSTLERNPALGFWLIDGHAAVDAIFVRDGGEGFEFERMPSLIARMKWE